MKDYSSYYSSGYDSYYDDLYESWYGGGKSKKDKGKSGSGWSWGGYSKKYKSALGWESSKFSDTVTTKYSSYSYSSWTVDRKSSKDLDAAGEVLKKAFREVRDFVVILDFPYQIHINISGVRERDSEGDYKSGIYIFIPTVGLFNDKTDQEILDNAENIIKIFCGSGAHEAAHLKYTTKRVLDDFFMRTAGYSPSKRRVINVITNTLEDERVEDKLLNDRPGYCDFIAVAKERQYELYKEETDKIDATAGVKKDHPSPCDTVPSKSDQFFRNLVYFIRYPNKADPEVLKEFGGYYKKIRSYINPFPSSTKDVCMAAENIYSIAEEIFNKYGMPTDLEVSAAEKRAYRKCSGGNDIGDDNASSVFCGIDRASDVDKVAANSLVQKLASGETEKGSKEGSYFERVSGSKDLYNYLAEEVKKYVPQIRNIVKNLDKNYDFNIYGVRSGLLDTNKLVEAYQGVPQVFVRRGEVRTNKTTVCILIDESGSMGSSSRKVRDYQRYRDHLMPRYAIKSEVARQAGVLLNEALSGLPGIDLYIYGHTADTLYTGSVELRVYKEGNRPCDKYALTDVSGRFENRDGDAILEAATRVRKFTNSNCLMFVISDGMPCARGYGGYTAVRDVRNKVTKVQNMGFNVVQVSIDDVYHAKDMFDTVIALQKDLSNFPKELSQVIKKAISKDKVTTIK